MTSIFFAGFVWNKIVIQLCCWHKESIQNTMIIMIPEPGRLKMEVILWPCRKFLVLPLWLMIFKEIPVRYCSFTSFFSKFKLFIHDIQFHEFFFSTFFRFNLLKKGVKLFLFGQMTRMIQRPLNISKNLELMAWYTTGKFSKKFFLS